jgi:hypothetical protein
MKTFHALQKQITRRVAYTALLTALVVMHMVVLPQMAHAAKLTPPPMPENIQVPAGNELYMVGNAVGTQNYICLPAASGGVAFKLFTPQATLFDDKNNKKQIMTHFFSPNPAESGTIRAAWEDSKESSMVWGKVNEGHSSTDPNFVAPGAIAWLLVTVVGSQEGPIGGNALAETTFIQRLNTSGGVAPSTGCASTTDIGNQAFVPYMTDYFFYRSAENK